MTHCGALSSSSSSPAAITTGGITIGSSVTSSMAAVAFGFFSLTQTTVGSISAITTAAVIAAISSDVTSGERTALLLMIWP